MARSASRSLATSAPGVLTQEIKFTQPTPENLETTTERLSLFEQIAQLPENLWWSGGDDKGFKVYLYDHEVRPSPYLEIINHPFDPEYVKQKYGGGTYRAQINDPDGKIVCREIFAVAGESKRKPPQNAQAQGAPPPSDTFQLQVLEAMREEQRETRRLMAEIMARDRNPAPAAAASVDPTTMFRGMVEMFKEMLPKQPQMGMLEMFALMEKMRGPDLLQILTQAKAAGLIPASAGNGDLMSQLTALTAVAEKLGWSQGSSRSLGEVLVEKLPEIAEGVGKLIDRQHGVEQTRLATAQTVRAIQTQQNGAQVIHGPQAPSPAGNPLTITTQPAQPHSSTAGLDVEPVTAGQVVAEMTEAQLNQVKQHVVNAVGRGISGEDIFGFLNVHAPRFLDGFLIRDKQGAITGVVTEDQLAAFCANDPVLQQAVPMARFKACVRELIGTINEDIGIEEADQAPDVSVQ